MRDHEHVAGLERPFVEGLVDVGRNGEVARGERLRSDGVGRVTGVRGLHLARELRADRPGLAVGFVEQYAGDSGDSHDIAA